MAVGFFAPLRDELTVRTPGETPIRVWVGSVTSLQQQMVSPTTAPLYRVVTGRDTQVEFGANIATSSGTSSMGGLRSLVMTRGLPAAGRIETDLRS